MSLPDISTLTATTFCLRDREAHSSVILTAADSGTYAKLGLRLTCTPKYQSNQQLYHK